MSAAHARAWTPERRAAAARVRTHKPWLTSTGPKTEAGKAVARMNALTHGQRSVAVIEKHREVMRFLREQALFLRQVRLMLRIRRQAAKSKISTNEVIKMDGRFVVPLPPALSPAGRGQGGGG